MQEAEFGKMSTRNCWIDTETVLQQEHWKSFFSDLSKSPRKFQARTATNRAQTKLKLKEEKTEWSSSLEGKQHVD
jgi:hypothetical protein